LAATALAVFGASGVASAAPTSAAAVVHASSTGVAPSGNSGTTIDPLQYNCGNDAPTCGQVGESYGYYNGTNVDLLYSENYYCDGNVASHDAVTGCEVGAPDSGSPSAKSGGTNSTGTSLGNTTHGTDTLYIPVPVFANPPATQCVGTATCIDHPPTADLSVLAGALGVSAASLYNSPLPAHNHVVGTRNNGLPEWWNVEVVATTSPTTFASLTSVAAIQAAQTAGTVIEEPTNISLFFQVLPGTVPAAQAANLTATAPPGPAVATPAADPPASQAETGTTFNNLKNDCGGATALCQNLGITHGWVSGTPGAEGQDIEALYSEPGFCSGTSGCEAGAAATSVPPGVSDQTIPTAANSYPGATGGNTQIDPLYIPVPLGFTPDYTQCPTVIVCVDHPATINLSAIAADLPGNPSPASLTNVPLPSHDHVMTTRNGDQPEWWNVEVVPVTSQAQLTTIENNKDLTLTQEEPFNANTNPGGAIDTNAYLWFQTLPGASAATPGPVATTCSATLPSGSVVAAKPLPDGTGYVETDAAGDVSVFGAATCYGSLTGKTLNKPIVGIAIDRNTGGYWLVASDGGVFAFNAPFLGSEGGKTLNKPIVGITTDINSQGYWLVASDGGVFSFNEPFYGSTGALTLNKPVVGMSFDRATGGYWLVASDGGVFSFNAPFEGSTGGIALNKPVVSMTSTSDGSGYTLFASDGGVFNFNSPFYGSLGSTALNKPVIAGAVDNSTDGYWMFASDGGVFTFNSPFFGSAV
jgi:hypothetical protein